MGSRRRLHVILLLISVAFFAIFASARGSKARDAVRLDKIEALTFQKDKQTSHRRVSAIPQLKCVGGSAKGLFEPETIRCRNSGSSYSNADVEWTCKASLPREFKLGSTEVVCEGYDSANDDFVFKGSCGLEYRLILTEAGEQKYGKPNWWGGRSGGQQHASSYARGNSNQNALVSDSSANLLFWLIFGSVVIWMIVKATSNANRPGPRRQARRNNGGGGGGSGDGDDDGDYGPPPPYSRTYRKPEPRSSDQAWRPGFWTGAAAGAAGAYFAGGRAQNQRQQRAYNSGGWFGRGNTDNRPMYDPGESSSGSPYLNLGRAGSSSERHESTGFGGTRRR